MGELTAERSARDGALPRGPVGSTWWWLLAFGVLTTAGLAAVVAAVVATCALLLTLGISPVDFVRSF